MANALRARRLALFERLIASSKKPLRIIDIGGTNSFWENRGWAGRADIQITTVNLVAEHRMHANIRPCVGDATNLVEFGDASFDIAFSNSVIEHLFTLEAQRAMAREVRRVSRKYWVQTPNYWFPIEPHFHVPGWQWMPEKVRVWAIRRWRCGWRGPCSDLKRAQDLVREVRLMTRGELVEAFPGASLVPERFAGLTKSWIVIKGLTPERDSTTVLHQCRASGANLSTCTAIP
jgi:hypothetical protein